jgi:hypothetical protein
MNMPSDRPGVTMRRQLQAAIAAFEAGRGQAAAE